VLGAAATRSRVPLDTKRPWQWEGRLTGGCGGAGELRRARCLELRCTKEVLRNQLKGEGTPRKAVDARR
jgi:hypothetical protein